MQIEDSGQSHTAGVIGTATEAIRLKGEISKIVKDCVANELRHSDNHIAEITSTLQGRLPITLRRAISALVTSLVKTTIHKANDDLLNKMIIGTVCPEENAVRALQEKVDGLDRFVHGPSECESKLNQLESTIKEQNETISELTKMVDTLVSANTVNENNLSKLQATVDDQALPELNELETTIKEQNKTIFALTETINTLISANTANENNFSKLHATVDHQALQVANIPKIMADVSTCESNLKNLASPDAQPTVDTEIITAIETKVHALETALASANTSIDGLTSADLDLGNRIEQINDSVEEVKTTDRSSLASNDRVEKIEIALSELTRIPPQVKVLEDRIRAQEAIPPAPSSLATTLRALESNIEDLGARMNNCENGVTKGLQSYHGSLDTIDSVKRTAQQSAEGPDAVRAQIEKICKHIDAIDDDLAKDDKRMQVLKNVVQTLDQKVKADSEDLTKLYCRVGACKDAYWRLSGDDQQPRASSPLAPIEESSSEYGDDSTITHDNSDYDTVPPDQVPVDGEAEPIAFTENVTASTFNYEAMDNEDIKDVDPGPAHPPNVSEDTSITEDLTASTSNKEAVNDEDLRGTDSDPARLSSAVDEFTKDLASGYKRSGEESGSDDLGGNGQGSVPAVEPQQVSSSDAEAGKAGAEGEDDDEEGVEWIFGFD
jgi:chromosome segregation ATPase